MRHILTAALLLWAVAARGQRLDPADYIYPVEGVSGLCSANFGEMRPGHFHGGVDIKTEGVEGKRLLAAADGYISRAVITPGGYGRALYLTMKNGRTAVYGHLQRFRDDIEEHIRRVRYERRSNTADLHFGPGQWPVQQGDPIGFSGNSGSSMGPHLHFEIRDTESGRLHNLVRERVIRPRDDIAPRILKLHYVEVDTLQGIPRHAARESYGVVRDAAGGYRLTRNEPLPVAAKGYFVVEVSDRRNDVHNTFGIWRVTAWIDRQPYFEYRMDGFTRDLSRCCDAVSCYDLQLASRNEAIRLAQLEGAPACFYPLVEERGLVRTRPGQLRSVRIEAEDDSGNVSQLEFRIRGTDRAPRIRIDTTAQLLLRTRPQVVALEGEARMHIPAGSLHESTLCRPERREVPRADTGLVVLSPLYRLLDPATPLRRAVHVAIRADVPPRLRLRTLLARRTAKGALVAVAGRYDNGEVSASLLTAGDVAVVADTLPPSATSLFAEGADLSQASELRFRATDNFAGIVSWELRIDGAWVPCDRLPMRAVFFHRFDTPPSRRTHEAVLTVTDACGNTTRIRRSFRR